MPSSHTIIVGAAPRILRVKRYMVFGASSIFFGMAFHAFFSQEGEMHQYIIPGLVIYAIVVFLVWLDYRMIRKFGVVRKCDGVAIIYKSPVIQCRYAISEIQEIVGVNGRSWIIMKSGKRIALPYTSDVRDGTWSLNV